MLPIIIVNIKVRLRPSLDGLKKDIVFIEKDNLLCFCDSQIRL